MSISSRTFAASLVALLAIGTAAPAVAACPGQSFVGLIDFTTRVTGAKSNKAIGVNGYYRMRVSMGAGCQLRVDLVKLGFNKIMFSKDKLQWGSFGARAYPVQDGSGNVVEALFVDAAGDDAYGVDAEGCLAFGAARIGEWGSPRDDLPNVGLFMDFPLFFVKQFLNMKCNSRFVFSRNYSHLKRCRLTNLSISILSLNAKVA